MKRHVEALTNNDGTVLLAVIYGTDDGRYITCEPSSSMGFATRDGAIRWLGLVCKGQPLTPDCGTFKLMPKDVQAEVIEDMKQAVT